MEQTGYPDQRPPTSGGAGVRGDPTDTLACTRRRLTGAVCLSVAGALDLATISSFRTQLRSAVEPTDHVILDFSTLRSIDFSGIHAVLEAYEILTVAGRRMALVGASPRIQRVLTAFGVDEILPAFSTVDAALADFRNGAPGIGAEPLDDTNCEITR